MPSFFVVNAADALATAPGAGNDGFDTLGLGEGITGGVPTWNRLTRTYTDALLAGLFGIDLTNAWVCVKSGTNWTPGLYQIESFVGSTGVIVLKAATGLNTTDNSAPVLSTGPKDTLANALSAASPGTAANPYTSYSANSACRIVLCALPSSPASHPIASALSLGIVGSAANHNSIVVGDSYGNVGAAFPGQITVEPSAAFTTGTALITSTFANPAYLDIGNIRFNGTANTKTATYPFNLNAANGDVTFTDCQFTGGTTDGLRVFGQRVALTRCRTHSNGQHGCYVTSSALTNFRAFASEAHSNTFDGFNLEGAVEGAALVECLSHHNSRHGFMCASSSRSTLFTQCIASHNAQHGFDLSGGVDIHLHGNISVANGTTSSHRQFNFGVATSGSRILAMSGNYAGAAAGGPVNTDATDLALGQLLTGSSDVLTATAVGTYDARLIPWARGQLRATLLLARGAGATFAVPPGLSLAQTSGDTGRQVYDRS